MLYRRPVKHMEHNACFLPKYHAAASNDFFDNVKCYRFAVVHSVAFAVDY